MKRLLLLFAFSFEALCALSQIKQEGIIKGVVLDSVSQQPLINATVSLFRSTDSGRLESAITDKNGGFRFSGLRQGSYRLSITYLGYRLYSQMVDILQDNLAIDIGNIFMNRASLSLAMVEIRSPVVVKKDTIEFDAGYFKTTETAAVEELLKKLPGVRIERDGTIWVNGESVKKLLVDGRPFFSNDPTMLTRNLTADIINKVQLIDGKSEESKFAGINDGKTEKVINITIKKDQKNSFIGNATAGYGTDRRFAFKGNLNRFKDKEQLSFIANGDNINGMHEGKSVSNTPGIIRNWRGGINYNKDLSQKISASMSYTINNSRAEAQRNSTRQNLLPDSSYYYDQDASSLNNNIYHTFNFRMEYRIDTTQMLSVMTNLNYEKDKNQQGSIYKSQDNKEQLVNSGSTYNANFNEAPDIFTSISFRKKLRKTGRAISIGTNYGYDNLTQQSFNRSENLFIRPNGEQDTDSIDQRVNLSNMHHLFQASIDYTEPIFKDAFIRFSYLFTYDYTSPDKLAYDYNPLKGVYDRLNDSLSNSFQSISHHQFASLSLRIQKGKYNYNVGLNMLYSNMHNISGSRDINIRKSITNIYPTASFDYDFTTTKNLHFNYSADIRVPTASELQKVPDNSNPLYIRAGNPDLKPSRTDIFNVKFNSFVPNSMSSFSAGANLAFATNKIVAASWIDSLGRQMSQPLNVNGAWNINANIENGFLIKEQFTVKTYGNFGLSRDINYVNGFKGYTNNVNASGAIGCNYTFKNMLDLSCSAAVNYYGLRYSLQKGSNSNYLNYNFSFNGDIKLPFDFLTGYTLDYSINSGRSAGYNQDIIMLNAYISKAILRRKQGLIKLQGFDLLKQNVSINRNIGGSYIEDVRTKVLRRFFLVGFSYFLK